MSATSAPFGLRPAFHPSGLDRAQALSGGIVSGYTSNIFKGQPVQYGTTANGGTVGTIIPATTSGAWAGAFAGEPAPSVAADKPVVDEPLVTPVKLYSLPIAVCANEPSAWIS